MTLQDDIKHLAEKRFADAKGSHDREHTLRVHALCMHIGKKENADLEILGLAALLHDIARHQDDTSHGKICHAEKGAQLAEEILKEYNVEPEKRTRITHCIQTHRYRGKNIPASKEAKILYDADKLDSIGAVGIGRAFMFAAECSAKFHNKNVDLTKTKQYSKDDTAWREYNVKLQYIKDKLFTDEGKRLAQERHEFMKEFFDRLNLEVEGKL
jgi:uncharacterized protein